MGSLPRTSFRCAARVTRPRALLACLLLGSLPLAQSPSGGASSSQGASGEPEHVELAGKSIPTPPHFLYTRTFNEGDPIHVAFDTLTRANLARRGLDVYLIEHGNLPLHLAGKPLDGPPLRVKLSSGGAHKNEFLLDAGTLSGKGGFDPQGTLLLGKGYDVAVDANANKVLDSADLLDGSLTEAGFHVVQDFVTFRDEATRQTGPYEVSSALFDGGVMRQQEVFFPTNVAALGELPLIVVSHGNGHFYRWYDHIGIQMASFGYVVMSHTNRTGPGIETASETTFANTDMFFDRIEDIADGVLAGHVDVHRIVWIGHSRGGEGVVRAYQRISLEPSLVTHYGVDDVKLVSSIAPTDFLGPSSSNMGAAPYHLWTGGADSDVNGCADCNICQTFHLLERADGTRFSISLHGAGHGDFHDNPSSSVAIGPCRIGRPQTHAIMRAYLLPLVQFTLHGNLACLDYLTRQWEEFRAAGAPDPAEPEHACVSVDMMYVPGPERERFVIDDFQSWWPRGRSSSGARVMWSVGLDSKLLEGVYDDINRHFNPVLQDAMNGMTLAGPGDTSAGAVVEWNGTNEWLIFEVPAGAGDFEAWRTLSFRGAQTTRSAATTAELGDLDFRVQLYDSALRSSALRIAAYGGGLEEPYQRTGCGDGAGWANEFETIRIPLGDFRRNGQYIDLRNVIGIAFLFGPVIGTPVGRIGLDEIMLTRD